VVCRKQSELQIIRAAALRGSEGIARAALLQSRHELLCALLHGRRLLKHSHVDCAFQRAVCLLRKHLTLNRLRRKLPVRRSPPKGIVRAAAVLAEVYAGNVLLPGALEEPPIDVDRVARFGQIAVDRVASLDVASYWFFFAFVMEVWGCAIDVAPLRQLVWRLPVPGRCRGTGDERRYVDAFNYCTHFLLGESLYGVRAIGGVGTESVVEWLRDFMSLPLAAQDIEYLGCGSWCLSLVEFPQDAAAIWVRAVGLAQQQRARGTWRARAASSGYSRFHGNWVATEALYSGLLAVAPSFVVRRA
jgi:hypothetical protein